MTEFTGGQDRVLSEQELQSISQRARGIGFRYVERSSDLVGVQKDFRALKTTIAGITVPQGIHLLSQVVDGMSPPGISNKAMLLAMAFPILCGYNTDQHMRMFEYMRPKLANSPTGSTDVYEVLVSWIKTEGT